MKQAEPRMWALGRYEGSLAFILLTEVGQSPFPRIPQVGVWMVVLLCCSISWTLSIIQGSGQGARGSWQPPGFSHRSFFICGGRTLLAWSMVICSGDNTLGGLSEPSGYAQFKSSGS